MDSNVRRCLFVVGTRAQLVKLAPVLRRAASAELPYSVWMTGQHADSIDDLLKDFDIPLKMLVADTMQERSSVLSLAGWLPRALLACRKHIREMGASNGSKPLTVIHGDTLSTLVGALAARSLDADVVHIESGLTSKSLLDPFPEEITRRLVFHSTRYALCPNADATSRMNRYRDCEAINTSENTLLDCVRYATLERGPHWSGAHGGHFVASIHRFQNIYRSPKLKGIVADLIAASEFGPVKFILHPATAKRLEKTGLGKVLRGASNVHLEERMSYTRFLRMLSNARAVFTDGGSNQEELTYLGVPTVLFRDRSERPDGLGRNVVFRRELLPTLGSFIKSGDIDNLRMPRRLNDDIWPSDICLRALERWRKSENK